MSVAPQPSIPAAQEVWNRRLGARFNPLGPVAHKMRFAAFRMESHAPQVALPAHVDLRAGFPPVTEQTYNCCVAESLTAAYSYAAIAQVGRSVHKTSSRLFLYYQARLADGMQDRDEGAYIGSGAQSLVATGICEETYHPYTLGPLVRPTKPAYTNALDHKAVTVKMVEQNLNTIKGLLATGFPVTIGFVVYPSIQLSSVEHTGNIVMPSNAEMAGDPLGGHAVVLVGYDDSLSRFYFRNSWGTSWGNHGYGTLPYAYILDGFLSQDFWVILAVNDDATPNPPAPPGPPGPPPTPPVPIPPVPDPVPTPTPPAPAPVIECCTNCPPDYCCCIRTRLAAARKSSYHL